MLQLKKKNVNKNFNHERTQLKDPKLKLLTLAERQLLIAQIGAR